MQSSITIVDGSEKQPVKEENANGYNYEIHPLAKIFPALSEGEKKELVESVRKNGLLDPVIVYQGKVLDGVHRLEACKQAGVRLRTEPLPPDTNPAEFVLAKNIHRRHLNASQRAALAAEVFEFYQEEAAERRRQLSGARSNPDGSSPHNEEQGMANLPQPDVRGPARDRAAEAFQVSPRLVSDALKLKKEDPQGFDEVRSGQATVSSAIKKLPKRKKSNSKLKRQAAKSSDQFVVVVWDSKDGVPEPKEFYDEKTYPNVAYFHLWEPGAFLLKRTGWCLFHVLFVVVTEEADVIREANVPVCRPFVRFLSLSVRGKTPAPASVPVQIIDDGLHGVIKTLDEAWPSARKFLVSNLETPPAGWELCRPKSR